MPNKNTITLITGASSGIGLELAIVFAGHGHNLLLISRNEIELKKISAELIEKYNVSVRYLSKDLSQAESIQEVYSYCQENELIVENLVNNAGFGDFNLFKDSNIKRQLDMINLNIRAVVHLTHLLLPKMIKNQSGKILNVASTAAFQPGPLMSVYYASKAFVLHFSEAIANELKPDNITVTALCPGPTKSNFKLTANLENSRLMKTRKIPTSKKVAEYGYKSLMKGKVVAIHGKRNYILAQVVRLLPRSTVVKMVRKLQEVF